MAETTPDEIPVGIPTILIDLTLHKMVTTTTAEPTEVPSIAATNTTIEVSLAAVETDSEIMEDALVDASVAADILEDDLADAPILPLNHHATTRRPRANTFMIPTILIRVTISKALPRNTFLIQIILLRVTMPLLEAMPWVTMPLLEAMPRVTMPPLEAMHKCYDANLGYAPSQNANRSYGQSYDAAAGGYGQQQHNNHNDQNHYRPEFDYEQSYYHGQH